MSYLHERLIQELQIQKTPFPHPCGDCSHSAEHTSFPPSIYVHPHYILHVPCPVLCLKYQEPGKNFPGIHQLVTSPLGTFLECSSKFAPSTIPTKTNQFCNFIPWDWYKESFLLGFLRNSHESQVRELSPENHRCLHRAANCSHLPTRQGNNESQYLSKCLLCVWIFAKNFTCVTLFNTLKNSVKQVSLLSIFYW